MGVPQKIIQLLAFSHGNSHHPAILGTHDLETPKYVFFILFLDSHLEPPQIHWTSLDFSGLLRLTQPAVAVLNKSPSHPSEAAEVPVETPRELGQPGPLGPGL